MHLLVAEEKRALIRKAGSLGIPFLASSTVSRPEASAPHPMLALLFQGRLEMSQSRGSSPGRGSEQLREESHGPSWKPEVQFMPGSEGESASHGAASPTLKKAAGREDPETCSRLKAKVSERPDSITINIPASGKGL